MRLLCLTVSILFTSSIAQAQMPNSDTRLPSVKLPPPQRVQRPILPQGQKLRSPLPTRNFGGHVYHGQFAWERGRWHHTTRNGRFGWWWDVGGVWYYYPEQIEGPPTSISNIEVADETAPAPQPPTANIHHAFYYRPGDLRGIAYETIEQCAKVIQDAGNIGICVMK